MDDLSELPAEVRDEILRPGVEKEQTLAALSQTIATLRDEAVRARAESGIEQNWLECEEAYLGIDDENRGEFQGARWAKPMAMEGPLVRRTGNSSDSVRATAFVRMTSRYVDAGAAKVCEVALPTDGKAFTLKPTPVPELVEAMEDETPAEQVTGQPMPGHDGEPVKVADLAKHVDQKAQDAAEKSANRIHDWMVEYKHPAEIRKVVFDGARIGTGVLKGPIPEARRAARTQRTAQGLSMVLVEEIKPAARRVDPWCCYPAPGCGDDIHRGDHFFELDPMLPGELRALSKSSGHFLPEAIEKVIKEGPGKTNLEGGGNPNAPKNKKQFQVWHFYGKVPRSAFEAANEVQAKDIDKEKDQVFAVVTLVNDTVIRAIQNPLDTGRLPYHVFKWSPREGHWTGVGVGEQIRTPQRICNAATRRLLSNGGQSSGSQVVMDPSAVEPANGDHKITPDKLWWLRKDSGIDDVRKVFASFEWPNRTPELMLIVDYSFKLAEEHSNIPLITQGQSGDTTPDTFGGQQLQDNNANQLLRQVGMALNDHVTTPLVDQFYEWLLLDPDIPEAEKGDFNVDTSGALAVIEKAINEMRMPMLLQMSLNQAYGLDPKKCMEGTIRAWRMVPSQYQYTEEELKQMAEQPPPKAPAVEAAEIRAASAEKIAQSRDQLASERNAADVDRDTAYNQSLANRDEINAQLRIKELELKVRLAELEVAKEERISLQEAKVKLADTTMKLQTQKELAGMDGIGPQVATPPTEPPGQAPDGTAYQA